jgi:hypothetical protein
VCRNIAPAVQRGPDDTTRSSIPRTSHQHRSQS